MAAEQTNSMKSILTGILFCTLYIVISGVLINYNKFLMKRFPYPLELTSMHMSCSWVLSMVLYCVFPSAFPAMERLEGRKLELMKYFLPLGCFFSIALYTSNKAYLYCGVAFLQFMKESNVVLIFLLSCAVGLQKMDRVKGAIVLWVLAGSTLCVDGEVNFVLVGFLVQGTSQLAECCKNVLGEFIMSGTDFKLDPLSYTMFMAPMALAFLLIGVLFTWESDIVPAAQANWHYLVPNALLAYCLNVTIAAVLKNCSAMGFILAGMVKDIVIVVVSSYIFGDTITKSQYTGFTVALGGVTAWSMIKLAPNGHVARFMGNLLCVPQVEPKEKLPLLASGK